jgi:hypothetical protein
MHTVNQETTLVQQGAVWSCNDWDAVHDSRPDQMMRPALRSTSSRASLSCRTLSMSTLRPV